MMMNKNDWIRDRVLYKARGHKLFEKGCIPFENATEEQKKIIESHAPNQIDPILIFWKSASQWTILGTNMVCSHYENRSCYCNLTEINKNVRLVGKSETLENADKFTAEFVMLENPKISLWVPAGPQMMALISILEMFPLGVPSEQRPAPNDF